MTSEVAAIVGIFGVLTMVATISGPLLLTLFVGRQTAAKELRDYARQDEVAGRAATAVRLVADTARITAETLSDINDQTHQIRTLVNGNLTAARQAELTTIRLVLAAVRRVVALDKAAGREPLREDVAAIEEAEERIVELEDMMAERALQHHQMEQEDEARARTRADKLHILSRTDLTG